MVDGKAMNLSGVAGLALRVGHALGHARLATMLCMATDTTGRLQFGTGLEGRIMREGFMTTEAMAGRARAIDRMRRPGAHGAECRRQPTGGATAMGGMAGGTTLLADKDCVRRRERSGIERRWQTHEARGVACQKYDQRGDKRRSDERDASAQLGVHPPRRAGGVAVRAGSVGPWPRYARPPPTGRSATAPAERRPLVAAAVVSEIVARHAQPA